MSLLMTIQAAQRGLKVSSEGINVVGHNTANASTEGYTRRSLVTTTMHPLMRGGHWLGQGARTHAFRRHTDSLVEQQIVDSYGSQSRSKEAFETMRLMESKLADGTDNSIVQSYQSFMNSLRQLTNDPGDTIYRSQVLDDAENFTFAVQDTSNFMNTAKTNIKEGFANSVDDINDTIRSIAEFNRRIRQDTGTNSNSDLMDQRDQLIADLGQLVGVKVHYEPNGQATVFINDHPAVQESNFREISYTEDSNGRPQLMLETNSGEIDITDGLGGVLGGKLDAYDAATEFTDDLDTFVTDFATAFNTQHALGFDLSGNAGGDFFSFSTTSPSTSFEVDATLLDDVTLIAAAANATAEFGDGGNLDDLIDIEDVKLFNSGAYNSGEFLSYTYSQMARKVSSAENDYERHSIRMDDMFELRSSISGVDLDQEAMKLMEYQASYEAAARVLTVSNQLLGELMNSV